MKNSVAIVTGAGRGIGAATASLLAERGVKVMATSRTSSELDKIQSEHIKTFVCDVSEPEQVRDLFDQTTREWGSPNVLINNAGMIQVVPFEDLTLEIWQRHLDVNLTGTFLCCKEAFLRMKREGGGTIVNVSSLAGIKGVEKFKGFSAYTAAKTAVVGFTEALSVEGRECGIRVNAVAPGAVQTRMLEEALPGLEASAQPIDIARVIAFLADAEESKKMTGSIVEVRSNG